MSGAEIPSTPRDHSSPIRGIQLILSVSCRFEILVSNKVIDWIAKNGYDKDMGARPMERFISQNIKKPLVDKLLFGNLKSGGLIKLDIEKGKLKFIDSKSKVKA